MLGQVPVWHGGKYRGESGSGTGGYCGDGLDEVNAKGARGGVGCVYDN